MENNTRTGEGEIIRQHKSYDRWTDDEVQALFSVYAEIEVQRELESANRNDKVYAKISGMLSERNIFHTAKQCREKLKKLRQDYKKIKDHNNRSGSEQRTSKWFDRLDALLGHRPAFSATAETKDAVTALEVMVEETDNQSSEWIEDDTELQAAECSPATTSSPCPKSPGEANKRHGKRKREEDVFGALRDMDDANRAVLQRGQEQQDQFIQLQLESQAEEREMRRRELAFLESEAEETRRLQRDFQAGFLSALGQLAQSLSQRRVDTAGPSQETMLNESGSQASTEPYKSTTHTIGYTNVYLNDSPMLPMSRTPSSVTESSHMMDSRSNTPHLAVPDHQQQSRGKRRWDSVDDANFVKLLETLDKRKEQHTVDTFDHYAQNVADFMRGLSRRRCAIFKKRVNDLMYEMDMEELDDTAPS